MRHSLHVRASSRTHLSAYLRRRIFIMHSFDVRNLGFYFLSVRMISHISDEILNITFSSSLVGAASR